jgi:hypothetical protein
VAPLYARPHSLFLLRNVELDDVGNIHSVGKDDARSSSEISRIRQSTAPRRLLK